MKNIAAMTYFFALIAAATPALADNQKKALEEIASFSERLCNSAPIKNESEELQLSGEAKVGLNGLVKKVVSDFGITGAAKYKKASYAGVLQSDLAKLISKDADCKVKISALLIDKLIPSTKTIHQNIISKESDCDGNPMPTNMSTEISENGNVTTITERSGGSSWVRTIEQNGSNSKITCAKKQ